MTDSGVEPLLPQRVLSLGLRPVVVKPSDDRDDLLIEYSERCTNTRLSNVASPTHETRYIYVRNANVSVTFPIRTPILGRVDVARV